MKRQLLVIRHADTESKRPGQDDHDRQLTARGRGDALRVAARIEQLGATPDLVLCSDAERAQSTWSCMHEVLEEVTDVTYTSDLYLAGVDRLLERLYAVDDECARVAVIAHNPGLQNFVQWLSGTAVRMNPCTVALLEGRGSSWAESLGQRTWEVDEVLQPRLPGGV
ncbi:MAG: SixA phosphatase family protein [Persicimonas sp.]